MNILPGLIRPVPTPLATYFRPGTNGHRVLKQDHYNPQVREKVYYGESASQST
jgi:hypothetical protein